MFDLLCVIGLISVLLAMLAHAAAREDLDNRASLETIQRRRVVAARQEQRRPPASSGFPSE